MSRCRFEIQVESLPVGGNANLIMKSLLWDRTLVQLMFLTYKTFKDHSTT